MELTELLEINDQIRDYGYQLHSIITEMDSLTGLITALGSVHDETIYNLGKNLPNEQARKMHREHLQAMDPNYVDWTNLLQNLKQEKIRISYEREYLKTELELNILDIRRSITKLESENMIKYIDNTNYIEELKQSQSFEVSKNV